MRDLNTSHGMASSIGLLFQLLTTIFALTLLIYGDGLSFIVLIIPTLFLFSMSMSSRKRDDYALLMFKLAVLLQSVLMWLSLFSNLFSKLDTHTTIESLYKPNVKNSYSNGYVTVNDHTSIPKVHVSSSRRKGDSGRNTDINAHKVKQMEHGSTDTHTSKINTIERKIVPLEKYETSEQLLDFVFGKLPESDFDDLKHRSSDEVRNALATIFSELPSAGFVPGYKNPCWHRNDDGKPTLVCLPYVYLLGLPKCGTSDLFARMVQHHQISLPKRKEIRFFTRGEFGYEKLSHKQKLTKDTSIYGFTDFFQERVVPEIESEPSNIITIDGGPHTLWWPTQEPDGSLSPEDIPPPQIIREMQPDAKFIVTMSDPVKRTYSDYHFLGDDLKPVLQGPPPGKGRHPDHLFDKNAPSHKKSAQEFHERTVRQINDMNACIEAKTDQNGWFRASQICAHDRHRFGVGGWGRMSISMYIVFIEKWLEHFKREQFLFVRLEDYEDNPSDYMRKVFNFLELDDPEDWNSILTKKVANKHQLNREEMYPETEGLLRAFFKPYNELLAKLLGDNAFLWEGDYVNPEDLGNRPDTAHNVHNPIDLRRHDSIDKDFNDKEDRKEPRRGSSFRTSFKPRSFDISGLEADIEKSSAWVLEKIEGKVYSNSQLSLAEHHLCIAAMTMDSWSLKYLLYDQGVPATLKNKDGGNALHCLGSIYLLADANSKSHVFNVLKGKESWISNKISPPLKIHQTSVLTRDIVDGLDDGVKIAANWLIRAGVDVNGADHKGITPLHVAVSGGSRPLVKALLDAGADPNAESFDLRTPVHIAASYGHAEVLQLLKEAGGNFNAKDRYGITPQYIAEIPGPISADDAEKYLGITQRVPKKIKRVLHPESNGEWPSNGGWGEERMEGWEEDMSCDVDQYFADEISGTEIFEKYIAANSPVLIRGLIDKWPAVDEYTKEGLLNGYSDMKVHVSSIPYAGKFGGAGETDMDLSEYISEMVEHRTVGGAHPWYVFKGHPIPKVSDRPHSLARNDLCPTPQAMTDAFQKIPGAKSNERQDLFVNAQWALGGEGTGAPVHFHNTAWNALVYGAKRWIVYPPHDMMMSSKQILDYFETDMQAFARRGINGRGCTQVAGDVMIIPESWAHGVLNIQESVAVATEARQALWRLKPLRALMDELPDDNKEKRSRRESIF